MRLSQKLEKASTPLSQTRLDFAQPDTLRLLSGFISAGYALLIFSGQLTLV